MQNRLQLFCTPNIYTISLTYLAVFDELQRVLSMLRRHSRMNVGRFQFARKSRDLIFHQRNQRRHNEGDAVHFVRVNVRWQLVAERFA